jgi:hypothetical protein
LLYLTNANVTPWAMQSAALQHPPAAVAFLTHTPGLLLSPDFPTPVRLSVHFADQAEGDLAPRRIAFGDVDVEDEMPALIPLSAVTSPVAAPVPTPVPVETLSDGADTEVIDDSDIEPERPARKRLRRNFAPSPSTSPERNLEANELNEASAEIFTQAQHRRARGLAPYTDLETDSDADDDAETDNGKAPK